MRSIVRKMCTPSFKSIKLVKKMICVFVFKKNVLVTSESKPIIKEFIMDSFIYFFITYTVTHKFT